jgi:hypothetical protein
VKPKVAKPAKAKRASATADREAVTVAASIREQRAAASRMAAELVSRACDKPAGGTPTRNHVRIGAHHAATPPW